MSDDFHIARCRRYVDLLTELVYCGIILQDESTLSSYGVKPGVTIHVLEKKQEPPEPQSRTLTESEIQQLVVAFRAFTLSAGYRTALQVQYDIKPKKISLTFPLPFLTTETLETGNFRKHNRCHTRVSTRRRSYCYASRPRFNRPHVRS